MYRIGVDIGGTFTDCVIHDTEKNRVVAAKSPSRREDLALGVFEAVEAASRMLGFEADEVLEGCHQFVHASTVATNAMIERDGARTVYVTTAGHEDTLSIGKIFQKRAGLSEREVTHLNRLQMADPPLVPRELVVGAAERVDYKGEVVSPLSESELDRIVEAVRELEPTSVAICLLWSFMHPDHERRIAKAISDALPEVYLSTSVDVAPVLGEYERGVTTALNAYLGPPIADYLSSLQDLLGDHGLEAPVMIMTCEGGVVPIDRAISRPVGMLDSGPTGGTLGSRSVGKSSGEANVICSDVGGTSFDVSLIVDGEFQLDDEPVISQYVFKTPKVAVKSIGAGGGSIAWVDELGVLKVGPQSAGANPGPACYSRGGTEPTVTDANLILGYIDPGRFLGGGMKLDREASVKAFEPVAGALGVTVEEAAAGVRRIINAHMADLLRASTIERGHDPRDFVLFAYGGAAAAHAVSYSDQAQVKSVYIPGDATAFSALGLLAADLTHSYEYGRPTSSPFGRDDIDAVNELLDRLRSQAEQQLESEGMGDADAVYRRSVLMRFKAQVHEVEIDLPAEGRLDGESLTTLVEDFTAKYERIYGEGSAYPDAGVEITTFRLQVSVPTGVDELPEIETAGRAVGEARRASRPAYSEEVGEFIDMDVYDGSILEMGHRIEGPAIIERYGDSIVIPEGFAGEVDRFGAISIEVARAREAQARQTDELDPITYEVVRNRLWAINDEQGQTAARKSGSQFIYEAFDFNSGLLDADGNGVFAGVYVLFHTTGLDMTVRQILEDFPDVREGDMFITNDPWVGAVHFNDFIVVTPIFAAGEIVSWGAIVMHQQDVGGPVPGGFVVGARNVFEECPIITPMKLMDGGRYCDDVERLLLRNTRTPMLNALNLRAMVASQVTTRNRVGEVVAAYGKATYEKVVAKVQEEVATGVKDRLSTIPDGEWFEQVYLDHDGVKNELYPVQLKLTKSEGRLEFDFTGTAPQVDGMINGTLAALRGGVMTAVLLMLCYEMPWSTGGLKDIVSIESEEGSLVNCTFPTACSGGSTCAEAAVENVAGTAIGRMLSSSEEMRSESMAVWYPFFNNAILAGENQFGEPLAHVMFDNSAGGGGARSWGDGVDCGGYFESVSCVCPNVESNEKIIPVIEVYRRRRAGSYGHGRYRGGAGLETALITHDTDREIEVIVTTHGAGQPGAHGIDGGYPSSLNTNLLLKDTNVVELLEGGSAITGEQSVKAGHKLLFDAKGRNTMGSRDMLITRTEGGPGFGDPLRRDPGAVLRDVGVDLCSPGDALEVYGVVIESGAVDEAATEAMRETRRRQRLASARPVSELIDQYGSAGLEAS